MSYQSGFGNEFATEALPGALPVGQNSPQRAPYGLYAEQLSRHGVHRAARATIGAPGCTASGRPRCTSRSARIDNGRIESRFDAVADAARTSCAGTRCRCRAATPTDFVDGLVTMAGNGDPAAQNGCGIHLYAANRSMRDRFFYDADGELLIVPQQGRLRFDTELGAHRRRRRRRSP